MNCCCSVNQVHNAYSLVSLLIKCGFELGTDTFNTLLKGLVLEGRVFEAFQLSELMRNQGFFMSEVSYEILIRGLCDSNKVDSALFLQNRIINNEFSDIYPNVVMFGTIIASLCKYERYEMAFHWYNSMINIGIVPNEYLYSSYVYALCQTQRLNEVVQVANQVIFQM